MDQFLGSLKGILSSRVEIRDAAYLYDIYPEEDDTEVSILASIQQRIESAQRKSSKRSNAKDIMSERTIPTITAENYPQYFVYQTDPHSESVFVFEVATLEKTFRTQPLINPISQIEFPEKTNHRIMRRICALELSYIALENSDGRTSEIKSLFESIVMIETVAEYRRMREKLKEVAQKYRLAEDFDTQARQSAIAGITAVTVSVIGIAYYYSSRVQNIGERDLRIRDTLQDLKKMIRQNALNTQTDILASDLVVKNYNMYVDNSSAFLTQLDASHNAQLKYIDAIQKSMTGTSIATDTITFYGFVVFIVFMYIFLVRRLQQTRITAKK